MPGSSAIQRVTAIATTLDQATTARLVAPIRWELRLFSTNDGETERATRLVASAVTSAEIRASTDSRPGPDMGRGSNQGYTRNPESLGWRGSGDFQCNLEAPLFEPRPGHPVAAYVYSEDRKGAHPAEHLAAFRGVLQVDGYAGFKRLAGTRADASVSLAFCWAHNLESDFMWSSGSTRGG